MTMKIGEGKHHDDPRRKKQDRWTSKKVEWHFQKRMEIHVDSITDSVVEPAIFPKYYRQIWKIKAYWNDESSNCRRLKSEEDLTRGREPRPRSEKRKRTTINARLGPYRHSIHIERRNKWSLFLSTGLPDEKEKSSGDFISLSLSLSLLQPCSCLISWVSLHVYPPAWGFNICILPTVDKFSLHIFYSNAISQLWKLEKTIKWQVI